MSLKKNVIANYLGQGFSAVIGLVFVPVYIRYLGVESWGLVGFLSMMQAWLGLLDMGLTPTLSREMARFQAGAHTAQSIRDLLRSLETIYVSVAVTLVSIVWFIAPWLAEHWLSATKLSVSTVAQAISVMGLVLATRMVEEIYRGAIQGLQRQVWLNGMQSALATLRSVGGVGVLACVSPSIDVFFYWQGLVSLLAVAVLARQTYRWLPLGERSARFDRLAVVRIRRFAGGMALSALLSVMLMQVDKLLLSRLVSLEDFGYYTLAASAAGALYFLVFPIVAAVSPRLTEAVTKSEQQVLINIYHGASQWLAAVLIPAALVTAVYAEPLLYVWTGDTSLAGRASPMLALLALGNLCNAFMYVPYTTQLAHGWTSFSVRVNIVAVLLIIPAIVWSVPRFGAVGAAAVWLALNASYVLVGIHFMHRKILPGEKWRWYWDAIFKPVIIGTAVMLASRQWVNLPQDRALLAAALVSIGLVELLLLLWVVPASRAFLLLQFRSMRGQAHNG